MDPTFLIRSILAALNIKIEPEQMAQIQKLIADAPRMVTDALTLLKQMEQRNVDMHAKITAIHSATCGIGVQIESEYARNVMANPPTPEQLEQAGRYLEALNNGGLDANDWNNGSSSGRNPNPPIARANGDSGSADQ